MVNWQDIDTVLLDMDGTLLDLHFDNHFWMTHLPKRYAEIHKKDAETAKAQMMERFLVERGTLNWYSIPYWASELNVDLVALKREVVDRIQWRPGAEAFLQRLRDMGKATWLVTNAHRDSLNLKLERIDLNTLIDELVSSHDFQAPKEEQRFWQRFTEHANIDISRALLVDDNDDVLDSAVKFGVGKVLSVKHPDSKQLRRNESKYPSIDSFESLF